MPGYKILTINPGSTSTKIALFLEGEEVFNQTVEHDGAELAKYQTVCDQLPYRIETILGVVKAQGVDISDCAAFCGRGGGLNSCCGGTYEVNDQMLAHAKRGGGNHPAALGCQIAQSFAEKYGARAFIVNPPDVDELCDEARFTGVAGVYREASCHTLNQKETAIRIAAEMGKKYEDCNFIVAHIGGGVSVAAHKKGRIVDSNGIINGEGPMAPTRCGAMPVSAVVDMCFSGEYSKDQIKKLLTKSGGFLSHLGTNDAHGVTKMIEEGSSYAALVYSAFQYQIAKSIGAMAAVLDGEVDAIILTGGISHDKALVDNLRKKCGFIAPVMVHAGEFEMEALAAGALRVLRGEEQALDYTGIPVFAGFDR